jgi:hypothetical protein
MDSSCRRSLGIRHDGDDRNPLPPVADMGTAAIAWWLALPQSKRFSRLKEYVRHEA